LPQEEIHNAIPAFAVVPWPKMARQGNQVSDSNH
jgi:hypothetical protein